MSDETHDDDWDYENAELHEPVPVAQRRTVVSVNFPTEDFQQICKAAQARGMKLSAFIRQAALLATVDPAAPHPPAVSADGRFRCVKVTTYEYR